MWGANEPSGSRWSLRQPGEGGLPPDTCGGPWRIGTAGRRPFACWTHDRHLNGRPRSPLVGPRGCRRGCRQVHTRGVRTARHQGSHRDQIGGGRGIRTPECLAALAVFKTAEYVSGTHRPGPVESVSDLTLAASQYNRSGSFRPFPGTLAPRVHQALAPQQGCIRLPVAGLRTVWR